MHAFIVTDLSDLAKLIKEHDAIELPFTLKKIADITELKSFTKIKQDQKTAIVIREFHEASEEAQNAFLKSLEEPQVNLMYILTTNNLNNILPTIISRCVVIESHKNQKIDKETIEFAKEFIESSAGKRLEKISEIKDRADAIEFLNNLIAGAHQLFLENYNLAQFLEEAQKCLTNIKQNGNVSLQLANFVVNLTQA